MHEQKRNSIDMDGGWAWHGIFGAYIGVPISFSFRIVCLLACLQFELALAQQLALPLAFGTSFLPYLHWEWIWDGIRMVWAGMDC